MKKISTITLWIAFVVTIVLTVMFFAVGEWVEVPLSTQGTTEVSPHLDLFLYWAYVIAGLGIATLVIFAIVQLIRMFQMDVKGALQTLSTFIIFAVLLVACYFASPEKEFSKIVNGETLAFTETTMKSIDMWLYSIYALLAATIIFILGFGAKKLISK